MADLKKNITKSICSARQWLSHAEDSFGNDRDIRGELDLLLAQAELQRVREANRSGHWQRKYSLFSHGLALCLALFIAVAGLGGAYWWVHAQKAVPVPLAAQSGVSGSKESIKIAPVQQQAEKPNVFKEQMVSEQPKIPTANSKETVQSPLVEPPQPIPSGVNQVVSEPRPAEKEVVLPPDEMQKLIRAAGKSLRGQ